MPIDITARPEKHFLKNSKTQKYFNNTPPRMTNKLRDAVYDYQSMY